MSDTADYLLRNRSRQVRPVTTVLSCRKESTFPLHFPYRVTGLWLELTGSGSKLYCYIRLAFHGLGGKVVTPAILYAATGVLPALRQGTWKSGRPSTPIYNIKAEAFRSNPKTETELLGFWSGNSQVQRATTRLPEKP